MAQPQAEPGSLGLGCEERLKQSAQRVALDTEPSSRSKAEYDRRGPEPAGLDTPMRARVARIHHKVDNHLLDTGRFAHHLRDRGIELVSKLTRLLASGPTISIASSTALFMSVATRAGPLTGDRKQVREMRLARSMFSAGPAGRRGSRRDPGPMRASARFSNPSRPADCSIRARSGRHGSQRVYRFSAARFASIARRSVMSVTNAIATLPPRICTTFRLTRQGIRCRLCGVPQSPSRAPSTATRGRIKGLAMRAVAIVKSLRQ